MNKIFLQQTFHGDVPVFKNQKKCNQIRIFNRCKRSKVEKRYQLLGNYEFEDITVKLFLKKFFMKSIPSLNMTKRCQLLEIL